MTRETALSLSTGDWIHNHNRMRMSDKSPFRVRVNGQIKTWVTRKQDIRIPVKFGMYTCFYITPLDLADWAIGDGVECQCGP